MDNRHDNGGAAMLFGSPLKCIVLFAIPILLSNLFQQLYTLCDQIVVGRYLGKSPFAAIGASGSIVYFVFVTFWAMCNGNAIFLAQKIGSGNKRDIVRSMAASYLIAFVSSLLIMASLLPLLDPLLRIMKMPEGEIFSLGRTYLFFLLLGLPTNALNNVAFASVRSFSDSVTPLVFGIVSSVSNIMLNVALIIFLGMGVEGVAIATIVSQIIAGIGPILWCKRKFPELVPAKTDFLSVDFRWIWAHLRISIPMALQFLGTAIGFLVLQSALNSLGEDAINSYNIGFRTEQLLAIPVSVIGLSMATFVAQNYGAGKFDRIRRAVKSATILSLSFAAAITATMVFASSAAVKIFLGEGCGSSVFRMTETYLRIAASFFFFLSLLYLHRNTLQGMGKAFVPFLGGIMELAARIGCSLYALSITGMAISEYGSVFSKNADAGFSGSASALYDKAFVAISFANPASWIACEILLFVFFVLAMKKLPASQNQGGNR